jgi:phenylacetate-coenzyme A ligase PaaK-like adenylate-forming protein
MSTSCADEAKSTKVTIDALVVGKQYRLAQKDKERTLLPLFREKVRQSIKHSPNMCLFYKRMGLDPDRIEGLADIPPLPVTMFKLFDLITCDKASVVRVLKSSATTTGVPSKIHLDKTTAFRQSRALVSILTEFIGNQRRPLLVIDTEQVNDPKATTLSARGAAIRGIENFAKSSTYVLKGLDDLLLDRDALAGFMKANEGKEVLIYGFTYILWTRFLEVLEKEGSQLDLTGSKVLHSGGWKKLKDRKVEKSVFNDRIGALFRTSPNNVIDFYGMVEQVGVIFPDCEEGRKHVPDFAEVVIRDPVTMDEVGPGVPGLIEVMSVLPNSYPGEAVLTEDLGRLVGLDDCPCGRKGKCFEFLERVEKAELRGCGDTFAERSGDR